MRDGGVKFAVRIHQRDYSFDELKRVWTTADRLGYHSATLYDLMNAPALECWTVLSALAAVTERIRLTPLVLANPYRPPALLAKMAATLDVISGGRLELGIGAGGGRGDHLASGYPFPSTRERVDMLEEALELITRLWNGGTVSFQGRYYAAEGATVDPGPVQRPRPPILVGGHGERYVLRAAARYADVCNVGFDMSLDEHRAKLDILQKHCREVGRDPSEIEVSHNTRVVIASTEGEYDALVRKLADRSGVSSEEYGRSLNRAVAGTPEQCVERLREYVDAGITYFFLLFPDPISTEDLSLFAQEVMPHFAPS